MEHIRNIAIIAHVDHGKTTLVDQLLKQSGTFRANQQGGRRASWIRWTSNEKKASPSARRTPPSAGMDYHVNIVDTPGHADFGGEVERIMKMIDGVLLVVDAHDGPQAQTKFVLSKALENGAKPIVVINKIDRENARPHKVLDMVFDLFLELNATDEQLDFPLIYASAKQRLSPSAEFVDPSADHGAALRGHHLAHPAAAEVRRRLFPVPRLEPRLLRLPRSHRLRAHRQRQRESRRERRLLPQRRGRKPAPTSPRFSAMKDCEKIEVESASRGRHRRHCAGSRTSLSARRSPTPKSASRFLSCDIDPPTITMKICINDAPLAGREGKLLTARQIRDRLIRETRTNVSLQVSETETAGHFEVKARGEMQIAILVEQMRREGFEILVSRPEVIFKRAEDGSLLEPMETLYVDVPEENLGDILQSLAGRKAEIINMEHKPHSVTVEAIIPTRGLIGFETDLVNVTKGHGIVSHLFKEYGPHKGDIPSRSNGVLVVDGGRDQHRLCARYHPGTRTPLHRASGGNL